MVSVVDVDKVRTAYDDDEANRLISQGWAVLLVYSTSCYGGDDNDGTNIHRYVLGLPTLIRRAI